VEEGRQHYDLTLTVTKDGVAQSGIRAFFLNADSTVVSNTTTDSAGPRRH